MKLRGAIDGVLESACGTAVSFKRAEIFSCPRPSQRGTARSAANWCSHQRRCAPFLAGSRVLRPSTPPLHFTFSRSRCTRSGPVPSHTGHVAGDGRGRALAAGGRAVCAQGLRHVPKDPFRCVPALDVRRTLMLMPSRVLRIRSVCVPMLTPRCVRRRQEGIRRIRAADWRPDRSQPAARR